MSSKSKFDSDENRSKRKNRKASFEKQLSLAKNHVSEDVKSKGGFPFHFAGPKKLREEYR